MTMALDGKRVLILGGTGSLGQRLFNRILTGEMGDPESVTVFSRDEAKQNYMRLAFLAQSSATDDIIYQQRAQRVQFAIGDVRSFRDVRRSVENADVIFHAAALKQVPTCEYYGTAAVDTNVGGAINLARAVRESTKIDRSIVGISTDKACKPVNVMGMTKALQERLLLQANLDSTNARFVSVRYGNVMASRGSAIPLFIDLVRQGKPIPITEWHMTRFLMTLDQSVDLIFNALRFAQAGETFLPMVPAGLVTDIAKAVAEDDNYSLTHSGIRPGEKIHEILVSEEEMGHTVLRGENLVILPILPELRTPNPHDKPYPFREEYSSALNNLDLQGIRSLLTKHSLTVGTAPIGQEIYK